MEQKVITNIRVQLYNYCELMQVLRRLVFSMFFSKDNSSLIAPFVLFENYYFRVMNIIYIINQNYRNSRELYSVGFQNIDNTNILLRGAIESLILLNVLMNNDPEYSLKYLSQHIIDKNEVDKFLEKSLEIDEIIKLDYDRYDWVRPLIDKKIITLSDLLDFTDFAMKEKDYYLYHINYNNNLSHPRLRNDSVTLDYLFGSGNVNDIIYIFSTVDKTIKDLIHVLLVYDYDFYQKEYKAEIIDFFVKSLGVYNLSRGLTGNKCKILFALSNTTKIHNKIRPQEFNTDITHVDNLGFWMTVYSLGVGTRDKSSSSPRLARCLDKYFETLTWHIKEVALSFEYNNALLFYTKTRYILELLSVIDLLLEMSEKEVEVYQTHTDIRNYVDVCRIPKLYLVELKSQGIISDNFHNTKINYNNEKQTIQQVYINNINFIKEFFFDKYGIKVSNSKIKHVNSWAINKIKINNKPPSNEELIINFAKKMNTFLSDGVNYVNFSKAIYTLVCSYCHSTSFSFFDSIDKDVVTKLKNTYRYLLQSFDYIVKKMDNRFDYFKEFKESIKNSNDLGYNYTWEYSINELLKILN